MTKRKSSQGSTIKELIFLIPNIINSVSHISALLRMETYLAGNGIVNLFILIILFAIVLSSTWISALGILLIYLLSIHCSWILSLAIIFLLNLVLLLMIALLMNHTKKSLFFPMTRKVCCKLLKMEDDE